MGFADWFVFKSAKQREKEEKLYARWAFPYGTAQREKLTYLMGALMPKENPQAAMAVFLMGREAYLGAYDEDPEEIQSRQESQKIEALDRLLDRQLFGKFRKLQPYYKVLILADAEVDENLNYPSVEELRRRAEELKKK